MRDTLSHLEERVSVASRLTGLGHRTIPLARIQGAVRLEALICTDGTIRSLRVLAGHPLLVKAAIDAVARWRYQPTLLNGDPVEVITEIDVNFALE